MSPGPFLEPVFVCKKAVLLLPACSTSFSSAFSFSFFFSLYPLVDVPVLRGFDDLWVFLSSISYFLVPWGTPCPFSECCGRAGEAVVVPSACLQSYTNIINSTSLSLGTRNLRISGHCSGSCLHHPINPGRYLAACAGDRQIVSAGSQGCCSRQPLWSGPARHRAQLARWPALPAGMTCPAPCVILLAESWPETWHPLTGISRKGRGRDLTKCREALTIGFVIPAQALLRAMVCY